MVRDVAAERQQLDRLVEGKTFPSVLAESAERFVDIPAIAWREGEATRSLTYPQYRGEIAKATAGFLSLGLQPGGFVTIMARNIAKHYIADMGAVHARGAGVSLYNTLAPNQIAYIVNHCEAEVAVVESLDFFERFLKIRQEIPRVRKVILLEQADEVDDEWVIGWDDLLAQGEERLEADPSLFESSWKQVRPDDLLTLIYTSGTTGPPKGVMITNRNVLWTGYSLDMVGQREQGDRIVSYLPLAHVAERATSLYFGAMLGSSVHMCPDVNQLLPTLLDVRPQIFFAVPRVFEKIYAGVNAKLAAETDESKRQVVDWAIDVGRQVTMYKQKGEPVPEELAAQFANADGLVLSQVRAAVGLDQLRYVISGAAPIAAEVLEFFHAIGVEIAEIYGQSEDTGPTSLNPSTRIKIGTVGPALPGVEVRIAPDGEVLVRGGNVSAGYYKDPELTAETFDQEGWLHSGDIGELDEDGYLRIVDRKKEIIITAGGKNIAPSNLEGALKQHPLIGQAAVIGDRRPFISALLVLDGEIAPVWAAKNGLEGRSIAELAADPRVVAEITSWVDKVNDGFSQVERIKRFTILPAEWTAESEELTPTMKLKRRVINEKYAEEIERMYA